MIARFLALALAAGAAVTEPIALEGPAAIEIADTASPRVARLAVKPSTAKIDPADRPLVIEFGLGDLRYDTDKSSLSAAWQLGADQTPVALVLTLTDAVRRAGVYRAIIAPLPASRPADRLVLQLTLRPATLKTPDKLVVAQTLQFPLTRAAVTPDLILHELSNTTRISDLRVSRTSANAGGLPTTAGVAPASAAITVAPGGTATIPYQLEGHFPLGLVSGKLWMNAPELAEPKELDYEVRTRLASWYIPIIIGVGFFLGYLVRDYLTKAIAVSTARDQASALLSQVKASLLDRRDDGFVGQLKPERSALDTALAKNDADAITKATGDLDKSWREAVTDYARRQTIAAAAVSELRDLSAPRLPLPPVAAAAFDAAVNTAKTAQLALDNTNVSGAQKLADEGRKALAEAVHSAILEWQDAAIAALNQIGNAQLGLPAAVVAEFAQRQKSMAPLNQVTPATALVTEENRRGLLLTFHSEYRAVRNLLQELANRLDTEWSLIKRELRSVNPQTPAFAELERALGDLSKRFAAAADDPRAFTADFANRLSKLDGLWQSGLLELVEQAKRAPLKVHLQNREFVQLAREVANTMIVPLLKPGAQPPAFPVAVWNQLPDNAPTDRAGIAAGPSSLVMLPPPVAYPAAGTARFWQSALLALVYIVIYWMTAADTFGEKWSEPATLLGTSFMIDVTAGGLLAALKDKIKS